MCAQQCVKPPSCSGHFLLGRSQREQLSMRVTQMIDGLLCGGQQGHLNTGTFTLEPPTPRFSCTIYILHAPPNQKPSVSVSFSLRDYRRNRKRCKATFFSKTNKQHNTTEPPHGGSLEMDYLSLNTHTPFSISLFPSQHLLFCDPNYKSQLEGER